MRGGSGRGEAGRDDAGRCGMCVMMRHDSGLCGVGGVGRCGAERLGAVRAAQGDAGWHIRFSTSPEAGRCGAKQDSEG